MTDTTATAAATPAPKAKTVYRDVTMADGSIVKFPEKRKLSRSVVRSPDGQGAILHIDADNGEQRDYPLNPRMFFEYISLGALEKFSQINGQNSVEDQLSELDALHQRVNVTGEWAKPSESDSFSGTHLVVRAMGIVTGKTKAEILAYIDKKLEEGKAQKLSRQKLYEIIAANERFAPTVKQLQEEAAAKAKDTPQPSVDIGDL